MKLSESVTTIYTYDAANKMTTFEDSSGMTTFGYDNNGNQIAKTVPGGNITTYTYNYENKMTGITYPDSSLNTFTYDGDGKRLQKQDSAGTLRFVFDPQGATGLYDLAKETDGSNNLVAFYTQGPMLLAMRRSGNSYFYHGDALGSTSAITSSDETTTSTYKYYAFGEVLAATGSLTNPFKYVGGWGYYTDPDSGLLLLRARYCWPQVGRFVTRDPGRHGRNWYVYVGRSPVVLVDPSGRQPGVGIRADVCGAGWEDMGVVQIEFVPPAGEDWKCFIRIGPWVDHSSGLFEWFLSIYSSSLSCTWKRELSLVFDVDVDVAEKHRCRKPRWVFCGIVLRWWEKFVWDYDTMQHDEPYRLKYDFGSTGAFPTSISRQDPGYAEKCKEQCEKEGHPSDYLAIGDPLSFVYPDVVFSQITRCREQRPGELVVE